MSRKFISHRNDEWISRCDDYQKEIEKLREQNSSLIKEVDELKRSLEIAKACWGEEMDDRMKKESQISQLKEALEKILKKLPDEDNVDYDPGDIINCIYEIASSATQALNEKE